MKKRDILPYVVITIIIMIYVYAAVHVMKDSNLPDIFETKLVVGNVKFEISSMSKRGVKYNSTEEIAREVLKWHKKHNLDSDSYTILVNTYYGGRYKISGHKNGYCNTDNIGNSIQKVMRNSAFWHTTIFKTDNLTFVTNYLDDNPKEKFSRIKSVLAQCQNLGIKHIKCIEPHFFQDGMGTHGLITVEFISGRKNTIHVYEKQCLPWIETIGKGALDQSM